MLSPTKNPGDLLLWDSAWWVFNFVSNYANLRYSAMIEDIKKVQTKLEGQFLSLQPIIEKTALELYKTDPKLLISFLTNYSVSQGEEVVKQWVKLGEFLLTKYNDGYVKDENGRPRGIGYPQEWLKKVIESKPDQFKILEWGEDKKEGGLH
jgi:dipeptidase